MGVSILSHGDALVASVLSDLSDSEVLELRDDLAARVSRRPYKAVIIDVTGLDVIDSFVARALRSLARTAGVLGARTMVAGIQPDVAIALVQFRLDLHPLEAALDLDDALARLASDGR